MGKNCNNCTRGNDCSMRNSCKEMRLDYCRFYEGEFKIPEAKKPVEFKEFEKVVRPLMKWVAENYDPHTKIIISYDKAEKWDYQVMIMCRSWYKTIYL